MIHCFHFFSKFRRNSVKSLFGPVLVFGRKILFSERGSAVICAVGAVPDLANSPKFILEVMLSDKQSRKWTYKLRLRC